MSKCSKCGSEIRNGESTCSFCGGAPVDNTSDSMDAENNKVMGILSYCSFLVLVPLFAAKESKFARFHANQGLILFVVEVLIGIITRVIGWIPVIGWLISLLASLVGLAVLVFAIIGIINAVKGEMKELPIIGGIQILK